MIEHNDIDAPAFQVGDLIDRRGAAIDGDQELRPMLLPATIDAFRTHAVAFLHPQRQKQFRRGAVAAQHFCEQRERGHAIDIVVAKKHDAFAVIDRAQNAGHGRGHVWEEKGVAEGAEARMQESGHVISGCEAFALQQREDARHVADFRPGDGSIRLRFSRRDDPTSLHG